MTAGLPDESVREAIARAFHEEYEHLAPAYGYETRRESGVDWPDVPDQNRRLMTHVIGNLIAEGIIAPGSRFRTAPEKRPPDIVESGRRARGRHRR